MPMTSANWVEVLEPILRSIFDPAVQKQPDFMGKFYNVQNATKAQETHLGMGSMGLMDKWTGQISYADPVKGFKKVFEIETFSKGMQIERFLVDDDQTGEIRKRTQLLGRSYSNTIQYHAAYPFNHAFDGALLGPDEKPLCSASHPVVPNSGTTYSNLDTLVLNADNVEIVRNRMVGWTDDQGNPLGVMPNTLVVAPAKRKTALVIADSDGEPDTADNNVNVWKGSLNVIEWPWLTNNTNAWFMIDDQMMAAHLYWYWRRKGVLEADGENFDTLVSKWRIWTRFDKGWDDPRFIYGCNAAS